MAAAKSALIIFRVLQMLISLVYCIPFGLFLSGLAAMLHWYGQPENVMRLSAEDVHDTRTGLGEATAVVGVVFALCILSFILSLTWLVFTASPRARSRAHCIGNHTLCVRYTCDMTWDILLVFFWTAMLAVVAGGLAAFDDLFAFLTSVNLPGRLKSSWGLSSDYDSGNGSDHYSSSSANHPAYSAQSASPPVRDDGTLSKAASMIVEQGRTVLVVAVALASVQVVTFIITAALSSANRNTLRAEAHAEVLPIVAAPKPAAAMVADGHAMGLMAMPPGGGKQQWKAGGLNDVGVHHVVGGPGYDQHGTHY